MNSRKMGTLIGSSTRAGALWLVRLGALTVILASAACTSSAEPAAAVSRPLAHSILVVPATVALKAGGQKQLAAEVNDEAGQAIGGATIEYRSASASILTVSAQGLVGAVGPAGTSYVDVVSGRQSQRVPVTVAAGPVASLELARPPAPSAAVGASFGRIEIRAHDRFGNAVADVDVAWGVTVGDGSIAPAAARTDADGLAVAQWQAGEHAGPQSLEVRAAQLEPLVLQSNALAGPATTMRLETQPPMTNAALPIGTNLKVQARLTDQHDNPVVGATIVFEAPRGCRLAPTAKTGAGSLPPEIDWPLSSLGNCELRARDEDSSVEAQLAVRTTRARR